MIEDIIASKPDLDAHAKNTLRSLLQRLESHAQPNNWAWQQLVNDWGYDPDYAAGDEGMHFSDNY